MRPELRHLSICIRRIALGKPSSSCSHLDRRLFHGTVRLSNIEKLTPQFSRQTNYYSSLAGDSTAPPPPPPSSQTQQPGATEKDADSEDVDPGTEVEVSHQQPGDPDAPPPTHYFDTNKIYTGLRFSGYTEGQAEVIMRAMRDILMHNLEECKETSIQQSNADNEAYLFEAARSELRTEIQKSRETQAAEYSSNLARLQRDVEIAHQELNESLTLMKSGIDIEINERKHTTNQEASLVNMKLQELNNRISIDIVSDLKSEIEALRWQTTRRGLLAVVTVIAALLISISLSKKTEKTNQVKKQSAPKGAEFSVPMLTSAEDEINYLEEKRFAVESLNEIANK